MTDIPDHAVAVKMLLHKLTEFGIIKDLNEIDGIGHRVVHGGEKFSDSVLLTDETIREIEEISELAPLHNPANIVGIKAFKEVLRMCLRLQCLIRRSTKRCLNNPTCTAYRTNTTRNTAFANTVSTVHLINT